MEKNRRSLFSLFLIRLGISDKHAVSYAEADQKESTESGRAWTSFLLHEGAGSVANFGTVLPLLFPVAVISGMELPLLLFWAGVWYILNGLIYRLPIPVEPLKAVAAVAIAQHSTPDEIAAAGILIGIIFLALGFSGALSKVSTWIPESVIRGIQIGLALLLLQGALFNFAFPDLLMVFPYLFVVIFFWFIRQRYYIPDFSALLLIGFGSIIALIHTGVHLTFPIPRLMIPEFGDFFHASITLVLPQIPLTLTNAIFATSLLLTDLFKKENSSDQLAKTIGLMSLSSSLFSGFPLCHGTGGLAAHHRFGARTGLALVIGGVFLLLLASVAADPKFAESIPPGIFAVLLGVVAYELLKHGIKTDQPLVTYAMAIITIPFGLVVAFLGGLLLAGLLKTSKINPDI